MSGNLTALQAIWATLPGGMLTGDKLAFVNSQVAPGPARDVERSQIKNILSANGAIATLQAYAQNPPQPVNETALAAVNYLLAIVGYEMTYSDTLQTSNPAYATVVAQLAPNLVTAGVSPSTVTALLDLIEPRVPWWQANGFLGPVNVMDLINAGGLY